MSLAGFRLSGERKVWACSCQLQTLKMSHTSSAMEGAPALPRRQTEPVKSVLAPENFEIGIIGMGLMGKMYARKLSEAGWSINACDLPKNFASLSTEFEEYDNVHILEDGHLVSRKSDWILYNVEAENIDDVVAKYARSTKLNAVVGGQTSCKAPEMAAFENYLPEDVDIISCHSLHAPNVDSKGQPLVIIKHRDTRNNLSRIESILSCFDSKVVYLTAEEHDRITADTQAVTHAAFLSMGAAWAAEKQFPWEVPRYLGGIENVKINITLRIYSNAWHVYAGLAILNPAAREQIKQYAKSATELFKLMLVGDREGLSERIQKAGSFVFKETSQGGLLLKDEVLDKFSLGVKPEIRVKNNHLSLLAMVDCWWSLGIVPFNHQICATPLFRLWLGAAEYLYSNPALLQECIDTGLENNAFRNEDLEFTFAARDWSQRVSLGNFEGYREKFESVANYFSPRFPEARRIGNEMIKTILEKMEPS